MKLAIGYMNDNEVEKALQCINDTFSISNEARNSFD